MSIKATATNGSEQIELIEVGSKDIAEMFERAGDAIGVPVYFADANGPDGLLTFPKKASGWSVDIWRHISFNPGPGDGRSAHKIGNSPYDRGPYTE